MGVTSTLIHNSIVRGELGNRGGKKPAVPSRKGQQEVGSAWIAVERTSSSLLEHSTIGSLATLLWELETVVNNFHI